MCFKGIVLFSKLYLATDRYIYGVGGERFLMKYWVKNVWAIL